MQRTQMQFKYETFSKKKNNLTFIKFQLVIGFQLNLFSFFFFFFCFCFCSFCFLFFKFRFSKSVQNAWKNLFLILFMLFFFVGLFYICLHLMIVCSLSQFGPYCCVCNFFFVFVVVYTVRIRCFNEINSKNLEDF